MPSLFQTYADAGFKSEQLPVVPPDAPLSPSSTIAPGSRGKIPGRKLGDGWSGFPGWPAHITTDRDIRTWQDWEAGLGLRGRLYPALDIDVDDEDLASAIQSFATCAGSC